MKNNYINTGFVVALLCILFSACDDNIDTLVDELEFNRIFTPLELTAQIRTMTTIELNWKLKDDADQYVVEFSQDSLDFNTIIRTRTVLPIELPIRETFDGDTRYSARVKAIAEGIGESKWAAITIRTAAENIFAAIQPEDITATEVTLKWPAGSEVTRLVLNPGNIEHIITEDEKEAGVATVTELTGSTTYTVNLFNATKVRGTRTFTTLIDLGGAIAIYPEDDMEEILDAAEEGDVFVVFPGTYSLGTYTITKSFTLSGYLTNNKPVIYGQFTSGSTVANVEFRDLNMRGDESTPYLGQFFNTASGCNITKLSIVNCEISYYLNNVIYNNSSGIFGDIIISGSYIHHITGSGGDGIDFRGGQLGSLTVENSTFANGFRTFLRMQVATNTLFKNCTFYKVSIGTADSNNAGLFRANVGGTFEVRNSLFVETGRQDAETPANGGVWTRNATNMAAAPTYANNNIYNCYNLLSGLYTTASQISASELNPEFVDAANGDFTVSNQTLIDNNIGDPRWLP